MIRASDLDRIAECPGSYWAVQGIPYVPSEAADEGTLLHRVCECDGDLDLAGVGDLTPEQCVVVGTALAQREALKKRLLPGECDVWGPKDTPFRGIIRHEVFWRSHKDGLSAKLDYVATNQTDALVVDYKFGRGEVEQAESNLQMRSCAVMAYRHMPHLWAAGCHIHVALIQPRSGRDPQVCTYEVPVDIEHAIEDLRLIREAAENPEAKRKPSPTACKFCPAKATARCPESNTMLARIEAPTDLAPQEMAKFLELAELVEPIIKAGRAHAKARLAADPDAIPGWCLKENAPRREIVDAQAAYDALLGLMTPEQFASACGVTIDALVKAVALACGDTPAAARRKVEKRVKFELKEIAPSLKRVKE